MLLVLCSCSIPIAAGALLSESPATASGFTGWSGATPSTIASGGGVSPLYRGSQGCSGYFTGTNPLEMKCRTSADTVHGTRVVVRKGTWNGSSGFGWAKAYYYHNLYLQPIVGTISLAVNPSGPDTSRKYQAYHYQTGVMNEEVEVHADLTATTWGGESTQDGHMVGVITGFCRNATGAEQPTCPTWVDTTATL